MAPFQLKIHADSVAFNMLPNFPCNYRKEKKRKCFYVESNSHDMNSMNEEQSWMWNVVETNLSVDCVKYELKTEEMKRLNSPQNL